MAALISMSITNVPRARAAEVYYVDRSSPSASTTGPGTLEAPYSTISAAVAARRGPGVTILVRPGVYRETVKIPASGSAGSPFVLRAQGAPVLVDGSEDYSSTAQWKQFSGDVWLAAGVTWGARQVFVDGARLDSATVSSGSLPARSYQVVAGQGLYVNAGGGNPGARQTFVGRRRYGINLQGQSYVTVDGFTVTRTDDRAILISRGSYGVALVNNTVTFAQSYGIYVTGCSGLFIGSNIVSNNSNSGIALAYGVNNSTVQDNESFRNTFPLVRQAAGIYVRGSSNNLFQRNRLHDNQDTGLDLAGSSNDNLCVQNVSWRNGDHGFDQLASTGVIHIGDVAWENYRDGFSIEGYATGGQLFNCIAINNGLRADTREFNLFVDKNSVAGFTSDYNIFWNSTSQTPIRYGLIFYETIQAFSAASHTDTHSIQADPRFRDPSAGEFQLTDGSPAVDSGNSGVPHWPATDLAGHARVDDPSTPNTGVGPVSYADRGALEYVPGRHPTLTASLVVTPPSGSAPLLVTADASGSSDDQASIVSYRFDFGDGTVAGPQTQATTTHRYDAQGSWTVQVTVTNSEGAQDSARAPVLIIGVNQTPVARIDSPVFTRVSVVQGESVNFTGTGTDPDGNLPLTYSWDFGGGAPNQNVEDPGPVVFDTPGLYAVTFNVTDNKGLVDPTPDRRTVRVVPNHLAPFASVLTPPGDVSVVVGQPVTFTATGMDEGGANPMYLWTFDGGAPDQAVEDPGPVAFTEPGTYAVTLAAKGQDGATAVPTDQRVITVLPASEAPQAAIELPASDLSILTGQAVYFRARCGDPRGRGPLRSLWDFGGGAPSDTAREPGSVTFAQGGTYTVSFTVWDSLGLASCPPAQRTIVVSARQSRPGTRFGNGSAGGADSAAAAPSSVVAGDATEGPQGPLGSGSLRAMLSPNPMRDEGVLRFVSPGPGRLRVEVFDFGGRLVRVLADLDDGRAGVHEFRVDARGTRLRPGAYYYRIRTSREVATGRFVVIR